MKIYYSKKFGKLMQITSLDERWYAEEDDDGMLKGYRPSLTWIMQYVPKGKGFEMWLGDKGYDEAQRLKKEAGERGSRVHRAIEEIVKRYMDGNKESIKMLDKFTDIDGNEQDLDPDEWRSVMTFVDWFKQKRIIKFLASEETLLTKRFGCTLDLRYIYLNKKDKEINAVTDIKTSQQTFVNAEGQLTGQKIACEDNGFQVDETSILKVGYKLNKRGWKEDVYAFQPELFDAAYTFWKKENARKRPYQRDYPIELSLF